MHLCARAEGAERNGRVMEGFGIAVAAAREGRGRRAQGIAVEEKRDGRMRPRRKVSDMFGGRAGRVWGRDEQKFVMGRNDSQG